LAGFRRRFNNKIILATKETQRFTGTFNSAQFKIMSSFEAANISRDTCNAESCSASFIAASRFKKRNGFPLYFVRLVLAAANDIERKSEARLKIKPESARQVLFP